MDMLKNIKPMHILILKTTLKYKNDLFCMRRQLYDLVKN